MAKNIVGQVHALKPTYEWVINNFRSNCESQNVGDWLESPVFSITHLDKHYKWRIRLYPKGNMEENKDFVSIYLYNCGKVDCKIDYSFILLDNNGQKVEEWDILGHMLRKGWDWGFGQFVKNETNDILNQNKITIQCDITFKESNEEENGKKGEDKKQQTDDGMQRLKILDEYESLIDQEKFSDVSFTVEGKIIHAHKCVLVKSSPVFTAMFEHKMKEKQENAVEIEDIRHAVFKEMLSYMYVGKIEDIEIIADELLIAADKYGLDRLKQVCEQTLCENLSVANAVECLKIADRYRADKLKAEAIEFIVSRAVDFIDKPEFKLLTQMPEVLLEVCQAMAKREI